MVQMMQIVDSTTFVVCECLQQSKSVWGYNVGTEERVWTASVSAAVATQVPVARLVSYSYFCCKEAQKKPGIAIMYMCKKQNVTTLVYHARFLELFRNQMSTNAHQNHV